MYGIYINLGCRFEFRTQKLPYERISGNFSNFTDFHAKKDHFSILAVFQNVWYLHKFWLQIWIQNQKIPYERISGNFSDFTNFGHFWILAVLQNIWDLHKFGLQIWIQNAKITLWKNFGQFFRFHRFWSSGPGMQKKISFQY